MISNPPLPLPLLLLIHLHILEFPQADNPEYDQNIFDALRGLRNRTNSMQDICHFLIGKLERGEHMRQVWAFYRIFTQNTRFETGTR